jgi:hypothetical protein
VKSKEDILLEVFLSDLEYGDLLAEHGMQPQLGVGETSPASR